jgi:hypothetical protein
MLEDARNANRRISDKVSSESASETWSVVVSIVMCIPDLAMLGVPY